MTDIKIDEKFFAFLKQKAQKMKDRVDPCRGGDGGAGIFLKNVDMYIAGMTGTIPQEWEQMWFEYKRENDLETKKRYEQYLKLKAEFGE